MRGRPPFEPTDNQRQLVQVLVSNGISHASIAEQIGVSEPTLRRAFKRELVNGHERIKAAMGAAIVRAGLGGNMFAAKYWLSTHGGPDWKVVEGREIGGLDGAPPLLVNTESKVVIYLPDNGRDKKPDDDTE
jgi:hypothetical protein